MSSSEPTGIVSLDLKSQTFQVLGGVFIPMVSEGPAVYARLVL
jgi:hypothetical protein